MRCWCGYLSAASCRLFAYGPADTTGVSKPHHLLPRLHPDWFYLSGTSLLLYLEDLGMLNIGTARLTSICQTTCSLQINPVNKRHKYSVLLYDVG